MSSIFFFRFQRFSTVCTVWAIFGVCVLFCGCHSHKTNRGYLFRSDWAFEVNRTPWIGCPPESGCSDDEESCGEEDCEDCCGKRGKKDGGLFNCGKKERKGCRQNDQKMRRHCGMTSECTAKKPCCRTLGCGMWINSSDPNSFGTFGQGAKACGLTPFCSPMKPCCLTPNCGRVSRSSVMMSQSPVGMSDMMSMPGMGMMPMPGQIQGPMPGQPPKPNTTPIETPSDSMSPGQQDGSPRSLPQTSPQRKPPVMAGPNGMLISKGIVPGVSTINGGGLVAAAGVATPIGMMTPVGVRLPNGMVNSNAVLKCCMMNPACSSGRPCGITPGCGGMVPLVMVSNNAMMLASTLSAQAGVQGGVMHAGGMQPMGHGMNGTAVLGMPGVMQAGGVPMVRLANGMYVNPTTGQPVSGNGLPFNAYAHMNYPPIGYVENGGYSPIQGRPNDWRYGGGLMKAEEEPEEAEEVDPEEEMPMSKSQMPYPRFHPVPSKPAFQRSEGLPTSPGASPSVSPKRAETSKKVAYTRALRNLGLEDDFDDKYGDEERDDEELEELLVRREGKSKKIFSAKAIESAMEKAYLDGMAAAMEEVEEEMNAQAHEQAKAEMQAKILAQAEKLQRQIDSQREMELQLQEERLAKLERYEQLQRAAAQRKATRILDENEAILQVHHYSDQYSDDPMVQQAQFQQAPYQQVPQQVRQQQARQQIRQPSPFEQTPNRQLLNENTQAEPGMRHLQSTNDEGMFVSALNFLKGNSSQSASQQQSLRQNGMRAYPMNGHMTNGHSTKGSQQTTSAAPVAKQRQSQGRTGFLDSVLSPIGGLISGNQNDNAANVKQRQAPPMPNQNVRQIPRPVTNTPETKRQTIVKQSDKSTACDQDICYQYPFVETMAAEKKAARPLPTRSRSTFVEMEEEDEPMTIVPAKPPRYKKPKKVIEVDEDDEEESPIRQANYYE